MRKTERSKGKEGGTKKREEVRINKCSKRYEGGEKEERKCQKKLTYQEKRKRETNGVREEKVSQ